MDHVPGHSQGAHHVRSTHELMKRLIVFLAFALAACDRSKVEDTTDYSDVGGFDSTTVRIVTAQDTLTVNAEVAATEEQRQLGLMERTTLAENAGMIFRYEQMQDSAAGFWMFRTRIPLDIAFIDSVGRIVSIRNMVPCQSPNGQLCPTYSPGARYQKALEVNAGWLARNGVTVGAFVEDAN
jgi:uncharacterized protein